MADRAGWLQTPQCDNAFLPSRSRHLVTSSLAFNIPIFVLEVFALVTFCIFAEGFLA